MTTHKILALTSLLLVAFPLRHAEILTRVADDCKCDAKDMGCRIMCSGIGSDHGTGGGSSTFDVVPPGEGPSKEPPIVVPKTDEKTLPRQIK